MLDLVGDRREELLSMVRVRHRSDREATSSEKWSWSPLVIRTVDMLPNAAKSVAFRNIATGITVHGRDEQIRTEYAYGHDPRRTPG
ncbi:hypothetical protein [Streptomyces himalayensis]|uniref:Uncharacterized protein n=1 Tax=Streptomyces himalayensis subsp. himalayensis TaxID=2756131 RepID=A0A7W0ICS0_9ACTN|nr:hypothetical protein [Streptomyces himalayensis]MBA2950449.1 hypothetical protein [Streptomyces himalayensis subsp. himalayensis]